MGHMNRVNRKWPQLDLISFDARFKKAFSYVFGTTIVVDDLELARKLGVGTVRMVTLDGDLVETSGAMQGGFFTRKGQAAFLSKNLVDSLETTRERVLALEGSIGLIQKERLQLDEKITQLREEKAATEGETIKLERSLHLEGMDSDLSSRKKNLNELLQESKDRLEQMQEGFSERNKELAQIKSRRLELREKINELRNPSLLAQLSAFEEKRSEIQRQQVRFETERKGIEGQLASILGPEVKKSRDIIKENHAEEEKFKNHLAETKERITSQTALLKEKEKLSVSFMKQFKEIFAQRDALEKNIEALDKKIDNLEITSKGVEQKLNTLNIDLTTITAELAGLQAAFEPLKDVEIFSSKTDLAELQKMIQKLEIKKESMGMVNLRALEVYDAVQHEYEQLLEKKDTLSTEKDDVHHLIAEIEESKKAIFVKNFELVNKIFKEFFTKLSTKGEAYLEIENATNPFEAGVDIKVKLSSKKFMDIKSLSGGEKTLTALAFIFAIQEHDPAYFYILDEVDAALDKHNSEKLSQLIKAYASRAQYIVISHNDAIVSEASKLYGIAMDEHGMSQVTTLEL